MPEVVNQKMRVAEMAYESEGGSVAKQFINEGVTNDYMNFLFDSCNSIHQYLAQKQIPNTSASIIEEQAILIPSDGDLEYLEPGPTTRVNIRKRVFGEAFNSLPAMVRDFKAKTVCKISTDFGLRNNKRVAELDTGEYLVLGVTNFCGRESTLSTLPEESSFDLLNSDQQFNQAYVKQIDQEVNGQ
ncbi:hypothetical protein CONCODRAFT_3825 [Conidiobolus coronatus NRRL 28638]|uniref:Uncharacterized protein n=1 Tax=Conidiobolus coronatus (strain ATCC 28846 / CBS 209.66 / NRRL 28638) TaxID=796925 RepID=A0A137PDV1_CONC2|nr:hypothetical protein CONCODRAFT_3825 [Conidiobolus coronatus NRRL 28638]|eukprot:KXN73160.1 hypothetical protein CONCODRAFT_3825 [Conidiobolus coronatus NRRL 28638]